MEGGGGVLRARVKGTEMHGTRGMPSAEGHGGCFALTSTRGAAANDVQCGGWGGGVRGVSRGIQRRWGYGMRGGGQRV